MAAPLTYRFATIDGDVVAEAGTMRHLFLEALTPGFEMPPSGLILVSPGLEPEDVATRVRLDFKRARLPRLDEINWPEAFEDADMGGKM